MAVAPPSMWIGSMAGNGNTNANDYDGTDKADDFIAEGVGFNIPELGGKSNYNNSLKYQQLLKLKISKSSRRIKFFSVISDFLKVITVFFFCSIPF